MAVSLWKVHAWMPQPRQGLWTHSGTPLLRILEDVERHFSETLSLDGTMVRMVIPA